MGAHEGGEHLRGRGQAAPAACAPGSDGSGTAGRRLSIRPEMGRAHTAGGKREGQGRVRGQGQGQGPGLHLGWSSTLREEVEAATCPRWTQSLSRGSTRAGFTVQASWAPRGQTLSSRPAWGGCSSANCSTSNSGDPERVPRGLRVRITRGAWGLEEDHGGVGGVGRVSPSARRSRKAALLPGSVCFPGSSVSFMRGWPPTDTSCRNGFAGLSFPGQWSLRPTPLGPRSHPDLIDAAQGRLAGTRDHAGADANDVDLTALDQERGGGTEACQRLQAQGPLSPPPARPGPTPPPGPAGPGPPRQCCC